MSSQGLEAQSLAGGVVVGSACGSQRRRHVDAAAAAATAAADATGKSGLKRSARHVFLGPTGMSSDP